MARLAVPVHPANSFSWSRQDLAREEAGKRFGVCEASTLGIVQGGPSLFSRVYDDASDVGFELVSSLTGKKVLFTHSRDVLNKEQEVVATVWASVGHSVYIEVHVLNT